MTLKAEKVRDIAHLARIALADEQVEPLRADLSNVLELVEQLQAVDTDGVEPMAHPFGASLRLREDVVTEAESRDSLQAPAPATEEGYFLVPRVIE